MFFNFTAVWICYIYMYRALQTAIESNFFAVAKAFSAKKKQSCV